MARGCRAISVRDAPGRRPHRSVDPAGGTGSPPWSLGLGQVHVASDVDRADSEQHSRERGGPDQHLRGRCGIQEAMGMGCGCGSTFPGCRHDAVRHAGRGRTGLSPREPRDATEPDRGGCHRGDATGRTAGRLAQPPFRVAIGRRTPARRSRRNARTGYAAVRCRRANRASRSGSRKPPSCAAHLYGARPEHSDCRSPARRPGSIDRPRGCSGQRANYHCRRPSAQCLPRQA